MNTTSLSQRRPPSLPQRRIKMIDTNFYNSYKSLNRINYLQILFILIKAVVDIFMLSKVPWEPSKRDYFAIGGMLVGTYGIQIIMHLWLLYQLRNTSYMLQIADNLGHTEQLPLIAGQMVPSNPPVLSEIVSERFHFRIPEDSVENLSDYDRRTLENNTENLIEKTIKRGTAYTRISMMVQIFNLIMGFTLLALNIRRPVSDVAKVLSIIMIVLELLSGVVLIIIAIVAVVVVLIVILFGCCLPCLYLCFGSRIFTLLRRRVNVEQEGPAFVEQEAPLEVKVYETSTVLNTEPECRICLQNFNLGDKFVVLPCDSHHVFHEFCVKNWFKVSYTCPMCRKNIGQVFQERRS